MRMRMMRKGKTISTMAENENSRGTRIIFTYNPAQATASVFSSSRAVLLLFKIVHLRLIPVRSSIGVQVARFVKVRRAVG
jgi:hypothetical protein